MKLNLNTILLILGGLGVFTPDVASVATWLASTHIAWMGTVVHGLGLLAAFCSAAPLVVPRLRAFLALLGLATPPGARAPWNPMRDVPPEDKPKGLKTSGGPGAAAGMLILGSLLFAGQARAQEPTPQFGGCIVWQDAAHTVCEVQAGPSVAVTVGKYEAGKFSAGLLPGVGYGVVLFPAQWYAVGLAAYGQLSVGGAANTGAISGLFSFANYIRFGLGETWTEQPSGPALRSTAYLFGLGSDFGGNTTYVKAQMKASRARAEEAEAQTASQARAQEPTPQFGGCIVWQDARVVSRPTPTIETTLVPRAPAPVKAAPVVEEVPPEIAAKAGLGMMSGTSSTPAR